MASTNNRICLFDKEGKYQFVVQGFDVLIGIEADGEHTFYVAEYSTSNETASKFCVNTKN